MDNNKDIDNVWFVISKTKPFSDDTIHTEHACIDLVILYLAYVVFGY